MNSRIKTTIKILVSLILMGVLVYYIDAKNLITILKTVSYSILFITFCVLFFEGLAKAVKQRAILGMFDSYISLLKLYLWNLKIFFISMFLPGEIAGGAARYFIMKGNLKSHEIFQFIFYEKYTQLVTTIFCGSILGIFYLPYKPFLFALWAAFGVLVIIPFNFKLKPLNILYKKFEKFSGAEVELTKQKYYFGSDSIKIYALSIIFLVLQVIFVYGVFISLGIEINILVVPVYLSFIILAQLLPISFGGLGVREVTTVGFLGIYGITLDQAVALSLVIYFLSIAKALVAGLIGMFSMD